MRTDKNTAELYVLKNPRGLLDNAEVYYRFPSFYRRYRSCKDMTALKYCCYFFRVKEYTKGGSG